MTSLWTMFLQGVIFIPLSFHPPLCYHLLKSWCQFFSHSHSLSSVLQLGAKILHTQRFHKQLVYSCRKCRKWFSKGVRGALRTEVIMSKQDFFPEIIFQVSQQLSGAIMAEKTEWDREVEKAKDPGAWFKTEMGMAATLCASWRTSIH